MQKAPPLPVAVFASRIANRVLLAFCDGCQSLALAASHTVGARARPLFFALWGKKFTHSSAKTFKKEVGQFIANGTGFPVLICWGAGFSPSVSLARSTSLVRGRHSSCVTLQVKMEHKKEVQHGKHSRPPPEGEAIIRLPIRGSSRRRRVRGFDKPQFIIHILIYRGG